MIKKPLTKKIKICPECGTPLIKARIGFKCNCGYTWARAKKTDKAKLIKACDDLYSLIIRSLGHCEVCRRSDIQLNAHHIKTRAIMILRYDFKNGVSLCVNHHDLQRQSAHKAQEWFKAWLIEHRPEDLAYVESKSNIIAHYSVGDLQVIYQRLKERYDELQRF